jgi:hypothetical protein
MSPLVKYSLARLGLFVAVAAVLLVLPLNVSPLIRLALALLISLVLALFLLRRLRDEVAADLTAKAQRRAERKERLRAALAGDEPEDTEP